MNRLRHTPTNEKRPARPAARARAVAACLAVFASVWLLLCMAAPAAQPPKETGDKPPAKSVSPKTAKSKKSAAKPAVKTEANQPKLPLELTPYRVRLLVAFGSDVLLTPAFRRHVLDRIRHVAARTFGQMWDLDVQEDRLILPVGLAGLERLSADDLRKRFDETAADKVYFLTIEAAGPHYVINGREWDARLWDLGAVATAETFQRREVPEAAVSLVARLFRPLLTVHDFDPETRTVELRPQAAEYPPCDPQAVGTRAGDVIVPVFRYLDRKKVVRQVRSLPLTYLVVDSTERFRVSATLVSAFRVPIGASRRRVEQLAMRVRPNPDGTRLRLVPRLNPTRPLVAQNVTVYAKTQADDEPKTKPMRMLTDRSGTVHIPVVPGQPVVWIEVRSGASLLARVPFVPGLKAEDTIELPDDSLRLSVEGEIALLQGRLIETIAKRSAHISRAKALAMKGDHDQAAQEVAALEGLPGPETFQTRLTAIRVAAVDAAEKQGNRSAESKINKHCRHVSEQIEKFLAQNAIRDLKEELREIRKLDAADRKALSTE